jgi:glycerophosphoryl diester phosphodiesterase
VTADQAQRALNASHRLPHTALHKRSNVVRLVAHRGSGHEHNDPSGPPENTLAAVRYGFEQGADAVEVDVWCTRDDIVVLHHDATTDRTTDLVGIEIAGSLHADVRAASAGAWKGPAWAGERIPSLTEATAVVPAGRTLVVEIVGGPQVVSSVVAAAPNNALFICKNLDTAAEVKAATARPVMWIVDTTPRWQIGGWAQGHRRGVDNERQGFDDHADTPWLVAQAVSRGLDGLDTMFSYPPELPAAMHDAGLRWMVWTANDPRAIDQCLADGVWGITTDNTMTIRNWLNAAGMRTAGQAGEPFWS